jgi:hypothetical protein
MSLGFERALFGRGSPPGDSGTSLSGVLSAILLQQGWPHLIEQGFNSPAVVQRSFEYWDHGGGHIETAPSALVGKSQEIVGVLFATGASAAVGADTGFIHQGQGTFECGPAALELLPESLLN